MNHAFLMQSIQSFLAIGVGLTFFTLGVTGMLGSDDILASFIVGNSFTWDDYFRVRTEDESFQDVLDSLLNTGVFIYIGTIIPWGAFGDATLGLSPWRFVVLGILILLFRRLPWVIACKKIIPDLRDWKDTFFTGWFGPIGVGAVYYAQVGLKRVPEDRVYLREVIVPIVYFTVLSSVIVHGITVPIIQHTPRVIKHAKLLTTTRSNGTKDDMSTKFANRNRENGAEMTETVVSPRQSGSAAPSAPTTRPSTPTYPRVGTMTPAQREQANKARENGNKVKFANKGTQESV